MIPQQLINKETSYSSRSKLECFQDCRRHGYLRYLWQGRGLNKRAASVYLATGSYTHFGLEVILKGVQGGNLLYAHPPLVDEGVRHAIQAYRAEIKARGFDLEEGENKENEQYVVNEQCALVEAFLRSFSIRLLPELLERFRILDVEREESVYDPQANRVLEGKLDVVFEEINSGDIYIVSFKTAAQWDRRNEKSNEHDNQGLSETYLLEHRLRKANSYFQQFENAVSSAYKLQLDLKVVSAVSKLNDYVGKFKGKEKVMGVFMIFFIKGKRYETHKGSGLWEQHCPLIRAYRKLVGADYEYSPSLYYQKPQNASGWGRLGKGWESFNVWEDQELGGVKGWIDRVARKNPSRGFELGSDVIGDSFIIPKPYFRNQRDIDSWKRQADALEGEIERGRVAVEELVNHKMFPLELDKALDFYFPQRRKGCHHPVDCEMLGVCYNSEIFNDPIGSGQYVYRTPHHIGELEHHVKLYNISQATESQTGSRTDDTRGKVQVITSGKGRQVYESVREEDNRKGGKKEEIVTGDELDVVVDLD